MKAFKFSMQRLLDAREAKEKACQTRLAAMQQLLKETETTLEAIDLERDRQIDRTVAMQSRPSESWEINLNAAYLHLLDKRIEACREHMAELRETVEQAREELAAATKAKKVLNKLAEKEKYRYMLQYKQLEQKQLDETAASAFARRLRAV